MQVLVEFNNITNIFMFYLVSKTINRKIIWLGHCILGQDGSWILTDVAKLEEPIE